MTEQSPQKFGKLELQSLLKGYEAIAGYNVSKFIVVKGSEAEAK